jgi:hypothetical protein
MKKIVKKTDEFMAVSKDGNRYTVMEFTTFTSFTPVNSGVTKLIIRAKEYRLDNGSDVNKISNGVFEILMTGERIMDV